MENVKILKDRMCVICGDTFDVKLEEGNRIPVKYFFSKGLGNKLMEEEGEYWECENCSGYMEERMKIWIIKNWGERCSEYFERCALCEAWRCYDYLFKWD